MRPFETMRLPAEPVATAPDGTDVRVLSRLDGGSFAHFELRPDCTSFAVTHRTVDEIWYVLAGTGEMWRRQGTREEIVPMAAGVCLTIPLGTHFQFRAFDDGPLVFVVATMPPWPGMDEGVVVKGPWTPSV